MTDPGTFDATLDTSSRIRDEMADDFDEELEMMMDEERLDGLLGDTEERSGDRGFDRRAYFREIFRFQHELVRLQDWFRPRA